MDTTRPSAYDDSDPTTADATTVASSTGNEAPAPLTRIELYLSMIPISTNDAYVPVGGRLLKSTAAKAFANAAKLELITQIDTIPMVYGNRPYKLTVVVGMENLFCVTYVEKGKGNRFRKMDSSNRTKIVEDVLAGLLGVDDACFVAQETIKVPNMTGTKLILQELRDPWYD